MSLTDAPYIIKISIALASILIFNRYFKNLIIAILISTLILGLWCGMGILDITTIAGETLASSSNLLLATVLFMVIWLSSQMEKSGTMNDLVNVVSRNISRKAGLAVLPALIGWLPMPGGALFSAPMVEQMDRRHSISPILKTQINYWFRHIWEYWWPLYPGVILAIDMTGLKIYQYMLLMLPLSFLSIAGGFFFLLRKVPAENSDNDEGNKKDKGDLKLFLRLISPILTVIITYGILLIFFPQVSAKSKYIPLIIGLVLALILIQVITPLTLTDLRKTLTSLKTVKLAAIVMAVRIYGALIENPMPDGNLIMEMVRNELSAWNIPVIAIVMAIPFLSGITTGIAVGFVGASFPIVINLLGPNPELSRLMSYTVIAYGFGYIGMMLSPVHVCHLVTNEYFKTGIHQSTYKILKPSSIIIAGSLIIGYLAAII